VFILLVKISLLDIKVTNFPFMIQQRSIYNIVSNPIMLLDKKLRLLIDRQNKL